MNLNCTILLVITTVIYIISIIKDKKDDSIGAKISICISSGILMLIYFLTAFDNQFFELDRYLCIIISFTISAILLIVLLANAKFLFNYFEENSENNDERRLQ